MGFKKGRAERASREGMSCTAKVDGLRHDGKASVFYLAPNGFEYKIDVVNMVQVNVKKGTRRPVHRRQGHDKNWAMWQFEAARAVGRNYTHSKTTYVQYPKEVCWSLEDRWRAVNLSAALGPQAEEERDAREAWMAHLHGVGDAGLREAFRTWRIRPNVVHAHHTAYPQTVSQVAVALRQEDGPDCGYSQLSCAVSALENGTQTSDRLAMSASQQKDGDDPSDNSPEHRLLASASGDARLLDALFEYVLQSKWPSQEISDAIRWLLASGFKTQPSHCRLAALKEGSLTVQRVLLMEANVDVRGFELLAEVPGSLAKQGSSSGSGSWIQRSKPAIKALLARGAVLGAHSSRSKLLRRLEEDGDMTWARLAYDGLCKERAEVPDSALDCIRDFLGILDFQVLEPTADDSD